MGQAVAGEFDTLMVTASGGNSGWILEAVEVGLAA